MRVLYVALTRAKEKLIITATGRDVKKNLEKKKELYDIYNSNSGKINPILIKKYSSYLDWIELVSFCDSSKGLIDIKIHNKNEISSKSKVQEEYLKFDFSKEANFDEIEKALNYKYDYELETELPSKSTVSKIKQMAYENSVDFESLVNREVGLESVTPDFLEDSDKNISSSRKGTLMHLMLQKINFKEEYDFGKINELKERLVAKNVISKEEGEAIYLNRILDFLNSDFAKRIKGAKVIEKEKPFCTKILAKEVYEKATDETILVQGIIDLYFIDENDNLILLDYKTDYVEDGKENILVEKYKKQLEIYKKALEEATDKKVYKTFIYSIYLNKEIEV